MSYRPVTFAALVGIIASQAFGLGSYALAADQTDTKTPVAAAVTVKKAIAPQTASISSNTPRVTTTTPEAPLAAPISLSLDSFRAAATAVDDKADLTVPAAPSTSVAGASEGPTGARFVPLLKADQPAETNNRATFVQQHEFGVQLRSNF